MFELASILILGILAQWFAWRIKVPAILPLILIGLLVGPISTFLTADGYKWIEPMYKQDLDHGIFPGQILFYFVSLSIGVILFEGGLTLKRKEIRDVGPIILKLISLGSFITFIGAAFAAHFLMNLSWSLSFLFSGLIIVTGPTVIAPILRNIPLNKNVATVLKWEGILIDPIGALVAVLVFEFIISGGESFTSHAFQAFGKILIIGTCIGFTMAYALYYMIKKKLIPHYLLNVSTLGLVLMVFVASDAMAHESGLLSVVVMGMVLGNLDVPELKGILDFKESLSILLISMLFILLAANIDISDLQLLLDWKVLVLYLFVTLVLRPLAVFSSSTGSGLSNNEKMFVSWVGPRGIVAAGIASLFGMRLTGTVAGAEYITPLVFMIVLGTVLFNATTARMVADKLGVILKNSEGIVIIGANMASRIMAKYLVDNGRHVIMVDNNKSNIENSKKMGIEGYRMDLFNEDPTDKVEFNDMAYIMALTGSQEVNKYVIEKFRDTLGEKGTYRLVTEDEMNGTLDIPEGGLFSSTDDFINFSEVARDYPHIYEVEITADKNFDYYMSILNPKKHCIPVFIKQKSGNIDVIPDNKSLFKIEEGDLLVYMGEKVDF